jgi:hypothetical protein
MAPEGCPPQLKDPIQMGAGPPRPLNSFGYQVLMLGNWLRLLMTDAMVHCGAA